jgi:ABC-type spermidine/putrescine transport system permease subunit I
VTRRSGRGRWTLLLLPHLLLTLLTLGATQFIFLKASLHVDTGGGQQASALALSNYADALADPLYLKSLRLSVVLSAAVVTLSLLITFPVAYTLARMRTAASSALLVAVIGASFVPVSIKIVGMVIIFAADGAISRMLRGLGLIEQSLQIVGTIPGVLLGCIHLSVGFMVMMLYAVIRTIPVRLEEAAAIHGATRLAIYRRIVMPLSLPGIVNATLIEFNLLMGAFVTTAVLGGGKILTFPVLIERTLMTVGDYGMTAALSAILLLLVLAINLVAGLAMSRRTIAQPAAA